MGIHLEVRVTGGAEAPVSYHFDQPRVLVGRSGGADVCLPHPSVSVNHLVIHVDGSTVSVQDEQSTNGSSLGGTRLVSGRPRVWDPSEVLTVGAFSLRLLSSASAGACTDAEGTARLARALVQQVLRGSVDGDMIEDGARALVFENGPDAGKRVQMPSDGSGARWGRGTACDVVLQDGDTSREHMEVCVEQGSVWVKDLGSKNGVLVNGRSVVRRVLRHGDEVCLGATRLVFHDPADAAVHAVLAGEDEPMGALRGPSVAEDFPAVGGVHGDPAPDHGPGDGERGMATSPGEDAKPSRDEPDQGSPGGSVHPEWVVFALAAVVLLASVLGIVALLSAR